MRVIEQLFLVPKPTTYNFNSPDDSQTSQNFPLLNLHLTLALEVERAWAHFKMEAGVTHKSPDYEAQYRDLLNREFAGTFSSFRHFEATRVLHNLCGRLGMMKQFKAECAASCNFLHPELAHDTAIFAMKDAVSLIASSFGSLALVERSAVALELMLMCDPRLHAITRRMFCYITPIHSVLCLCQVVKVAGFNAVSSYCPTVPLLIIQFVGFC